MPTPEVRVPIALLSQTGESSRHLREALAAAGAPIVYEVHASQLDRDALEQSGARVVVVNLDADVDAHLDDVYALLGDDRYNVIFNESQVSAQLSGWEQARWARHLAAKILGTTSADPPRPEGAQPVPARAPVAREADPVVPPVASEVPPAPAVETGVELAPAPSMPAPPTHAALDLSEFDAPAPAATAFDPAADFGALAGVPADPVQTGRADPAPALDLSGFDVPAVDEPVAASLDMPASGTGTFADAPAPADDDGGALGFGDLDDFAGSDGFDTDASAAVAVATDGQALDAGPDDTGFDFADVFAGDAPAAPMAPVADLDPAGQIAASAEAIERASEPTSLSDLELLDLDWADAPTPPETAEAEAVDVPPPPPVSHTAFAWTLSDVDEDGGEADPSAVADVPASPKTFGIETIPASEFLTPAIEVPDVPTPPPASGGLSLELVPLEEAVAPQAQAAAIAPREAWLDTSAFGSGNVVVRKVWVLGASIGGPEAVREFLARIPKDYPALFLLAQHMGPDFMQLMAQQLVRTTALTVRTPTHGERVAHGDIVVVPTTHRLRVDAQGVVTLEPLGETTAAHSPSIDQVIRDVADRFGDKAGAIIFSGMAEDAAVGCRYLSDKGGKVFVQDPQTCVISSMVDGVLETGIVGFTGSPLELADRVLGERVKFAATSQGQ